MTLRMLPAAVALLAIVSTARADVKIVQSTTIKTPQQAAMLQRLSPDERAEVARQGIGAPVKSTTYISGTHVRIDIANYTTLVDTAARSMTIVNRQSHQYEIRPLSTPAPGSATVTKTIKTCTLLGHRATLYIVTVQTNGNVYATGEVWAASDIPKPPPVSVSGASASMIDALHQIDGMPLLVNVHAETSEGGADVTSAVKSISTAQIPANVFKIPAGCHPAPAGAGVGAPPLLR